MGCGASTTSGTGAVGNAQPKTVGEAMRVAEEQLAMMMGNSEMSAGAAGGNASTTSASRTISSQQFHQPETVQSPSSNSGGSSPPAASTLLSPASTASGSSAMEALFAEFTGISPETVTAVSRQIQGTDMFRQVQSAVQQPDGPTKVR